MNAKRWVIISIVLYVAATFGFFINNVVGSQDKGHYQQVIEKEEIVEQDNRAMLRAFYSAPPIIPHEVESEKSKDCLTCHLDVTKLDDGRIAMKTPHPQFSSCLQCHVSSSSGQFDDTQSHWKGLEEPKRGDRWFLVSPPTIPHRVYLRENCLSCHGPSNPDTKMRTTHPERTSCLQCHVPDYSKEF